MPPDSDQLWWFLLRGYAYTVAIELPVLLVLLSRRHPWQRRVFAGFWLTACTYPVVVIVLPPLVWAPYGRGVYLLVAEVFAPLAECVLFYVAMIRSAPRDRLHTAQDMTAIVVANLASFLIGEWMF